jgi:hypothetical protein
MEWEEKRQRLLNEKIDVTHFLVDFIERYPASGKTNSLKKSTVMGC